MCTAFTQIYGDDFTYFAWDALTAAYVLEPTKLLDDDMYDISITQCCEVEGTGNGEGEEEEEESEVCGDDDTESKILNPFFAPSPLVPGPFDVNLDSSAENATSAGGSTPSNGQPSTVARPSK